MDIKHNQLLSQLENKTSVDEQYDLPAEQMRYFIRRLKSENAALERLNKTFQNLKNSGKKADL